MDASSQEIVQAITVGFDSLCRMVALGFICVVVAQLAPWAIDRAIPLADHEVPKSPEGGFTLIELVATLVILAVLAATALPNVVDLGGSAKASVLDGTKAALESAASLVLSRSAASGTTTGPGSVVIDGHDVPTLDGWPDSPLSLSFAALIDPSFTVSAHGFQYQKAADPTNCMIGYSVVGGEPLFTKKASGC